MHTGRTTREGFSDASFDLLIDSTSSIGNIMLLIAGKQAFPICYYELRITHPVFYFCSFLNLWLQVLQKT